MSTVCVTGAKTTVISALKSLVPDETFLPLSVRGCGFGRIDPPPADRYIFAHGLLVPARLRERDSESIAAGLSANLVSVLQLCEAVFMRDNTARICVIGSESGFSGSHDTIYSVAKAGLHHYVRTKQLTPDQQLVCVAPTIIMDSNMTQRRDDLDDVKTRVSGWPKLRGLYSMEIARAIHWLLWLDAGYTTGTVIRMHGGESRCLG